MTDYAALAALAESSLAYAKTEGIPTTEWCNSADLVACGFSDTGAAYVAAADPTTVLDLLRALSAEAEARAAAEAECDRLRKLADVRKHTVERAQALSARCMRDERAALAERDEARAAVERVRALHTAAVRHYADPDEPEDPPRERVECSGCAPLTTHPCATIRALDAAPAQREEEES